MTVDTMNRWDLVKCQDFQNQRKNHNFKATYKKKGLKQKNGKSEGSDLIMPQHVNTFYSQL